MRKGIHIAATSLLLVSLSNLTLAQDATPEGTVVDRPDRGDRIERRLDRRGDIVDHRLDRAARRAHATDHPRAARRLDRVGDRIDRRLDRQGRQIDRRIDRRQNRRQN